MRYMFNGCSSLTTLDVSNFNTDDVTDMGWMFNGCSNLTTLDVSKFNTANVTDMGWMFCGCSSLTTLDVSKFNTENVTDMNHMFDNCDNISELNLNSFDTKSVIQMYNMFAYCRSLKKLDLSSFNTESVETMYQMFLGAQQLETIIMSNSFNTKNVTAMENMFYSCTNLVVLDLRSFDTRKVTSMWQMFSDCSNLTTIFVSDQWSTQNVNTSPDDLFVGWNGPFSYSPNLIGNAGTTYSEDHQDVDYAHIDTESNPGYLTTESYKVFYDLDGDGKIDDLSTVDWENDATPPTSFILDGTPELPIPNPISKKGQKFRGWKGTPITGIEDNKPQKDISIKKGAEGNRIYTAVWDDKEAYVVVSADSTTLTFYYDDQRSNRTGAGVHGIDEFDQDGYPKWINVVYDGEGNNPWIENPYTTVKFDDSFKNARPSSCRNWFWYCTKLKGLEGIANLNTEDVTDMYCMFRECRSLTTLDVSNFNTENVTDMFYMFDGCSSLTTLDISKFNTENVMDMSGMFYDCSNLTTLDVSKFNTDNVTDMDAMFCGCSSLTTLDISKFNTENVTDLRDLFFECRSLTSLDVSKFDTKNVTRMCRMFYGCSSITTLDVSNFNTENVTDMDAMFFLCSSLTTLDISKFNTENVTYMSGMFLGCSSLTTLDVSNFNTENVTDMRRMFAYCDNLSTIIVSDKWKTTNVKTSAEQFGEDWYEGPFSGLPNLIGNAGTTYSDDHQDVDYAHIDTESNPGYLTTGSYKVFYNLDGGKWADGVNSPTSFALDLKENIKIPSPKKSGMKFVGWTGTLASGISSETPTMNVQITPDKLGNRIYTAHWEPKTDVKSGVPEKITYPDNPQDNEGFCNGTQKYFTIKFSLPDDKIATGYELAIPKIVAKADALTGVADDDMIDYEITVDIPDDKQPGAYSGTLTLSFGENTETKEYSLTLEVAAARNVIMHLYKEVIFVNNHDGLYGENGTYQWYHNNQEIPKANYQYLHDPNMSGKYKARMLTTDGVTVYSCPIDEGEGLSKDLKLQVKTYPNPVVAGNEFTLEIEEYDPSAAYTIHISNSNGVVVKEIANATEYSSVTLPRGIYSCVLLSGGRKRGFKIIVK